MRRGNLARVLCNARFLILPSVQVPHLASHPLGRLAQELPDPWQARCGVRPLLLETRAKTVAAHRFFSNPKIGMYGFRAMMHAFTFDASHGPGSA